MSEQAAPDPLVKLRGIVDAFPGPGIQEFWVHLCLRSNLLSFHVSTDAQKRMHFFSKDYGGVRKVLNSDFLPAAPAGLLKIDSSQICMLNERRLQGSRRRIEIYLRSTFPEVADKVDAAELREYVRQTDEQAITIGLKSEAGRKRWAYLEMASNGRLSRTPGALDFISNSQASPDKQIEVMIDQIAAVILSHDPIGKS